MGASETTDHQLSTPMSFAGWARTRVLLHKKGVCSNENTVTRLLARRTRRDFLVPVGLSTALLVGNGLIYLSFGMSPESAILAQLLFALGLPVLHISCSMRVFAFKRSLMRSGRAAEWLAAPLERGEFGHAFQRVFWSSTLWCGYVAVAAVGIPALMSGTSVFELDLADLGNIFSYCLWFGAVLITVQWVVFWGFVHSILAGILAPVFCVGLFAFSLASLAATNATPAEIVWLALFIFWGTGLFLSRNCYVNYRDHLVANLFP